MSEQAFDLKGEMSLLNVLVLCTPSLATIRADLEDKLQQSGQALQRSPIIVDCQLLADQASELDLIGLKQLLVGAGLIPVGLRNFPEALEEVVDEAIWPLLRPKGQAAPVSTVAVESAPAAQNHAAHAETQNETQAQRAVQRLIVVERPVRSGQQVYCPDGDIVVMQQTSAGSELLAGGSVHIYGTLRGRVLAGIHGDINARIFCQKLEAELIAIAGRYRLLDEIDSELKGQAVMVYLQDEKLKIAPI